MAPKSHAARPARLRRCFTTLLFVSFYLCVGWLVCDAFWATVSLSTKPYRGRLHSGTPLTRATPRSVVTTNGTFHLEYHPSAWENEWFRLSKRLASGEESWREACEQLRAEEEFIERYLDVEQARQQWTPEQTKAFRWEHDKAISYFSVMDAQRNELYQVPVEPLVGALRHPRFPCYGTAKAPSNAEKNPSKNAKDWLITSFGFERIHTTGRALFFEVGGTGTYTGGEAGEGLQWFIERFEASGIRFDRVFAWEEKPQKHSQLFEGMPQPVLDSLSYYNVAPDATLDAQHNPWRTLKSVAKEEDFVVVKIDIDDPEDENSLVDQLLLDESLRNLIDEFFIEHHVRMHPLSGSKPWTKILSGTKYTIWDSYDMLQELRYDGIRAHSWI